MSATPVRIGLLGCGNVGSALVSLVAEQHDTIRDRTGLDLAIVAIAVRDTTRARGDDVDAALLTDDPWAVVGRDDVDIVIELIGGIEPAHSLVRTALTNGKPVITGNKALLAAHGPELYEAADTAGVDLLFEAAVAGGIPLIRSLRESLVGEPIRRVMGIVNGTTNYILSQMSETGAAYDDALAEAQRLGYAEADPTADVEGHDAAAKAAIIATIAFGAVVAAEDVACEGISGIGAADIARASSLGYVIKLLAVAEHVGLGDDGAPIVAVHVHPAMLPTTHPLASVRDSFNAAFVEGGAVDDLMLYGRGAGGRPTASAVLGDLIDAAGNLRDGTNGSLGRLSVARIQSIDDLECEYYLTMEVTDEPGVLAGVAGVFGANKVSIRSMEQHGRAGEAELTFITHRAVERDVRATIADLAELESVRRVGSFIRVMSP